MEANALRLQSDSGEEMLRTPAAIRETFTHGLTLRRARRQGQRAANIRAALLRGLAFAAAYPQRALSAAPEDAPIRELAAGFLREIVGRRRDPAAVRLRRAAEGYVEGEVQTAWAALREAVLLELRLPAAAQIALLSPSDVRLEEVACRELVYFARAGTREIRVMAARRLRAERHRPEARRALAPLVYDPDPWLRAAASE
jgi:hypothetical protein